MELDPRIRIRAPLRCDGIGRLDCAEDADSGARLAVRWLPLEANGDAAVKACARLPEHPTLPRIRQTGQVGASAFLALDFPEGQLLTAFDGERLDNRLLLSMAGQLADALATVHEQGVVHGEVSADSVLIADGRAYLWDMPLVIANRLTDRRGENRLMQNLVKTAAFLAPERARGEGASQAGDVYALGVVLCVAAGSPLPAGRTTLAMVHEVAAGSFVPRVPSHLPEAWREVLSRMLSADPAQRPSAAQVAAAFAEAPSHTALPTVPEFPAVKLPAELLQAAVAMAAARDGGRAAGATATSPLQLEATAALSPAALDDVPEVDVDLVSLVADEPGHDAGRAAMASVALTDTVSVAADLARGSVTLSRDEIDAMHRGRVRRGLVAGGLTLAVLGLAMVGLVLFLRPQQAPARAPVSAPRVEVTTGAAEAVPAPEALEAPSAMTAPAAAAAPAVADDEPFPLAVLPSTKKARSRSGRRPSVSAVEDPRAGAAPAVAEDGVPAQPPVEAPPALPRKNELKRPEL